MTGNDKIEILLVNLKNHGYESDFKSLYNILYDRFFRIAIYYLKKEEWAQEVVLDVFFTLWNKRFELSNISNFDNYCFILLKNASLNYLSKHKKEIISLDQEAELSSTSETPEEILLNEELLRIYINALDELPPKCREVFILIREQKLSYKEVADQLHISSKTVDAQLQKAVRSIKDKIKSYFS